MTASRHLEPDWSATRHGRRFDDRDVALALALTDEWEAAGAIAARAGIDARRSTRRVRVRDRLAEMADARLIDWRRDETNERAPLEFRRFPAEPFVP